MAVGCSRSQRMFSWYCWNAHTVLFTIWCQRWTPDWYQLASYKTVKQYMWKKKGPHLSLRACYYTHSVTAMSALCVLALVCHLCNIHATERFCVCAVWTKFEMQSSTGVQINKRRTQKPVLKRRFMPGGPKGEVGGAFRGRDKLGRAHR